MITKLVNETDITLIPTMNPDGFDRGQEGACSGNPTLEIYHKNYNNLGLQVPITRLGGLMREIEILTETFLHGGISTAPKKTYM